jgi:hypothetical protein
MSVPMLAMYGYDKDNSLLLYYMIDKTSKIIQGSKDKSMTI